MTPRAAHPIPGYETLLGEGPKPVRLQLSREKGFNLQTLSHEVNGLDAVNVARPSKWGNPFVVGRHGTRAECVDLYRKLLAGLLAISGPGMDHETIDQQHITRRHVTAHLSELSGRNLACWCHGEPCHAETLLDLANRRSALPPIDEKPEAQASQISEGKP